MVAVSAGRSLPALDSQTANAMSETFKAVLGKLICYNYYATINNLTNIHTSTYNTFQRIVMYCVCNKVMCAIK